MLAKPLLFLYFYTDAFQEKFCVQFHICEQLLMGIFHQCTRCGIELEMLKKDLMYYIGNLPLLYIRILSIESQNEFHKETIQPRLTKV